MAHQLPAPVNIAAAYLASLPSATGRDKAVIPQLRAIARLLGHDDYRAVDWRTLNAANVAALLARMSQDGRAPNTVKLARAVLRGLGRKLYELGEIDERTLRGIEDVKAPAGSRLQAGRDITEPEKVALMDAANTLPSPRREMARALLSMFMAVGPRIHEIANAALEDINLSTGEWRIIGKGNKERLPPLNMAALRALRAWLAVRGPEPGPLFCAINKSGTIRHDGQLSTVAIQNTVKLCGRLAGVEISSHDFRRTVAGDLLDAGVDLRTGMSITGHSKADTFLSYDRRDKARAREAVELIAVPE
jgi:site-specific recombinase XerC